MQLEAFHYGNLIICHAFVRFFLPVEMASMDWIPDRFGNDRRGKESRPEGLHHVRDFSLVRNDMREVGNDKGGAFFTLTFETPLVLFGKI
jgi:hypothetical protein